MLEIATGARLRRFDQTSAYAKRAIGRFFGDQLWSSTPASAAAGLPPKKVDLGLRVFLLFDE